MKYMSTILPPHQILRWETDQTTCLNKNAVHICECINIVHYLYRFQNSMKVKVNLPTCITNWALGHECAWRMGCIIHVILTSALVGGEWSASWICHFTLREGATGTHWIGSWVDPRANLEDMEELKILDFTGTRSPTHSQSLYRLCYSDILQDSINTKNRINEIKIFWRWMQNIPWNAGKPSPFVNSVTTQQEKRKLYMNCSENWNHRFQWWKRWRLLLCSVWMVFDFLQDYCYSRQIRISLLYLSQHKDVEGRKK
jgi:hypothetical protein